VSFSDSASDDKLSSVSASAPVLVSSSASDDDDEDEDDSDTLLCSSVVRVDGVDSTTAAEVETEESLLAVLASARAFLAFFLSALSAFYKENVSERH
jgi:hypothetical protein